MTRWLVTGAAGMLGQDMIDILRASRTDVTGLDHCQLDITDPGAVSAAVAQLRPDVVVNCAAWTDVDAAESEEKLALAVNGAGTANLAAACAAVGARLMQLSTDYVFSGTGSEPYSEDDHPAPRTAYGRTKLAAEQAVRELLPETGYVLRTAWLYGQHGRNFVRTMIRQESAKDRLVVVDDQRGQPTWAADVARQILLLAESRAAAGIYHATSSGATTWMGLARAVFRLLGADPSRITPTSSGMLARPAPRPAYSVLGHAKWASAGLPALPDWEQSLQRAFPALAASEGRQPAMRPVDNLLSSSAPEG